MNIVILGCSSIGSIIARQLSLELFDVTIVDNDPEQLAAIQEKCDVKTIVGHPSYPDILKEACGYNTDIIIAVSDSDEINMIACQIAHTLFNVGTKIAKISSPHYLARNELFGDNNLPIDVFINTEKLLINLMMDCIAYPGAQQIFKLNKTNMIVAKVQAQPNSSMISLMVSQIDRNLPSALSRIIQITRNGRDIVCDDTFILKPFDIIYFVCEPDQLQTILQYFHPTTLTTNSVMIGGGGKKSEMLASSLLPMYDVKVIEQNRQRCLQLVQSLPDATILHGDTTQKKLLLDENITHTDLFCAMTPDDEDNLISSLQAKYLGAKRVITLINRIDYLDIFPKNDLDTMIIPQQVVINDIFKHIHKKSFDSAHAINSNNHLIVEYEINNIKNPIYHNHLPSGIYVCCILRDGAVLTLDETNLFISGDILVLLIHSSSSIQELEYLFSNE